MTGAPRADPSMMTTTTCSALDLDMDLDGGAYYWWSSSAVHRYRASNLLLSMITPGLKESDPD
ncbi:hypothetical protein VTO73DRAFT_13137 [Trametes versicolor]